MAVNVIHATPSTQPDSGDGKISSNAWNEAHTITGLSTVATSGAFADLTAKPTTVAGYGITDAETAITAGTTAQYWRGDKSWQTLDKTAAGLANVDNTSDANKPVSTATQTALDAKQAVGSYLTANQTITLSGDASGSGTTAITVAIGAGKVTLAMQANMATASVVYRKTAGAGAPEVQTLATLKTDLGLTGTNSGDQTITLTGDVTGSGTGSFVTAIGANKVTRSMLAAASGATLLGATAAGNVADLTPAQAKTVLSIAVADVAGAAPTLSPSFTGAPTFDLTGDFTLSTIISSVIGKFNVNSGGDAATVDFNMRPEATKKGVISFTHNAVADRWSVGIKGSDSNLYWSAGDRVLGAVKMMLTNAGNLTVTGTLAGSNLSGTNTGDQDLSALATKASPQFTGVSYYQQPAPTALSASATLTIAQMLTLIITATSTTAVSLTLPTGTLTDAGILSGALAVNEAFEWYVINLGSSSGAVTMVAGTGHTIVGNAAVAIATSARFLTRKTATNTFVTYRIA